MASNEQIIQVEMNTKSVLLGVKEVSGAFGGLKKTVGSLGAELSKAFGWAAVTAYIKEAVQSGESLDKELLVLRLGLGKLKSAIGQAIAPLGAIFIPIMQEAVWAATRLVRAVGQVIGALLGGGNASQSFSEETQKASDAQVVLAKTGTKVKRSLAEFDELIRLGGSSGSGESVVETIENKKLTDNLTPQLQVIIDKIQALLEPIRRIDFSAAIAAFGRFREAIAPFGRELFAGLEWAWHNLLVPLAAWSIENLLPAFLGLLSGALQVLNEVVTALKPMGTWLWNHLLQPIAQWTGTAIIDGLHWMTQKLEAFSGWIGKNQGLVRGLVVTIGTLSAAVLLANGGLSQWNLLGGKATGLTSGLGMAFGALSSPIGLVRTAIGGLSSPLGLVSKGIGGLSSPIGVVSTAVLVLVGAVAVLATAWDSVKTKAQEVWQSIREIWTGAGNWFQTQVYYPLKDGFKNTVNSIIGLINGMLSGAVRGINALVRGLNSFQIDIPSWIPVIGGKTFGFDMDTVTAPQIPYLAQGAVLPANRPFMAVLGDQRYGTNIEAPLDTIKQAVAEVLAMQSAGNDTVVKVNFTGDLAQLARILKPAIDTENHRRGSSLAKGGF